MSNDSATFCACGHVWVLHDIEEKGAPETRLCCVEGCNQAGCPGRREESR